MGSSLPQTRLYVDMALSKGADVRFDAPQSHKLRHVLRCSSGDAVSVFNGRDGEWRCDLTTVSRKECVGRLANRTRPQANTTGPAILFAPLKRQRMAYLVEKATELGATSFRPVLTEYSAIREVNLGKMQATIREAAEQCHRLDLASTMEPTPLFECLATFAEDEHILYCDEGGAGTWGLARASGEGLGGTAPAGVLIGPEGGFSPPERARLLEDPRVIPISLGPRPLRAETAAVAAIACWHLLANGVDV